MENRFAIASRFSIPQSWGGDSRKFVFSSNCVNASAPQSGAHHCAILAARASVRPDLSDAQHNLLWQL